MLTEPIEEMLKADAQKEVGIARDVFRGSGAGRCTLEQAYQLLGVAGEPLTPRRRMVFDQGHLVELQIQDLLKKALGARYIDGGTLLVDHVDIAGVRVSLHIDGVFEAPDRSVWVIEIKSMSNRSFQRACEGMLDRSYLAQAYVYHKATGLPVVFLCYRKETSHVVEILFSNRFPELVVTARFGGAVDVIEKEGPLLITEVRTPFDTKLEAEVEHHYRVLDLLRQHKITIEEIPGNRVVEPETISVQGAAKAGPFTMQYGQPEQSGSWYKFTTGRQVLGFSCNYCDFKKHCFPGVQLEIKNGVPKWVVENEPRI